MRREPHQERKKNIKRKKGRKEKKNWKEGGRRIKKHGDRKK